VGGFPDGGDSPGGVGLRLRHVDGEALLLGGGLLQHAEDDPGVRVREDFLRGGTFKCHQP